MAESLPVVTIPVDTDQLKEGLSLYEKLTQAASRYREKYGAVLPTPTGRARPGGRPGGRGVEDPSQRNGTQFLNNVSKISRGIDKSFGEVNKTLDKTIGKLTSLFETAVSWSVKAALLGGGGVFGYDLLARRNTRQYMAAQGLGISTGSLQAAKTVFGNRFGNVEGTLHGLAQAQNDITSPAYAGLTSIGIDPAKSAADNLPKLYQAIADLTAEYKESGLAYTQVRARKLDSLISPEVLNQIMANRNDIPALAQRYEVTSRHLAMSDQDNRSFQSLITTLDANFGEITTTFKTRLATLNKPIGELTTVFTHAVTDFINGPNGKAVFDTLKEGLESFSKWISDPGFRDDLHDFSSGVSNLVTSLGAAVKWLARFRQDDAPRPDKGQGREALSTEVAFGYAGWLARYGRFIPFTGHAGTFSSALLKRPGALPGVTAAAMLTDEGYPIAKGGSAAVKGTAAYENKAIETWASAWLKSLTPSGGLSRVIKRGARKVLNAEGPSTWPSSSEQRRRERDDFGGVASSENAPVQYAQSARRPRSAAGSDFTRLEQREGLPANLLGVVEQVESGGQRFAESRKGAKGPFQFMDATARDMGLKGGEVFDREKAADAAARYFGMLFRRYAGDAAKAVAAYNWGMGNVDKYGLAALPKETASYLRKILPRIGEDTSLARIRQTGETRVAATTPQHSKLVVDVSLIQTPGADITAQLKANMPPPIIIPV